MDTKVTRPGRAEHGRITYERPRSFFRIAAAVYSCVPPERAKGRKGATLRRSRSDSCSPSALERHLEDVARFGPEFGELSILAIREVHAPTFAAPLGRAEKLKAIIDAERDDTAEQVAETDAREADFSDPRLNRRLIVATGREIASGLRKIAALLACAVIVAGCGDLITDPTYQRRSDWRLACTVESVTCARVADLRVCETIKDCRWQSVRRRFGNGAI